MVRILVNTVNKEFENDQQNTSWPFTADSTFQTSLGLIAYPCFTGALLYPTGTVTMPFRIKTLTGTAEYVVATIADTSDTVIGSATCYSSELCAKVKNNGLTQGIVSYTQDGLEYLRSFISGRTITIPKDSLIFSSDICIPVKSRSSCGINMAGNTYTGDVTICASGGIAFSISGTAVRVNMYGEIPTMVQPITSINDSASEEVWLAAIPGSGVRVETVNNTITYGKVADYGTIS